MMVRGLIIGFVWHHCFDRTSGTRGESGFLCILPTGKGVCRLHNVHLGPSLSTAPLLDFHVSPGPQTQLNC